MNRLPELQETPKQALMTTVFNGYNHNEVIRDGDLYDMENLSGDLYPILSLRKKRAWTDFSVGGVSDTLSGIDGRDQLTFVLGTDVYWNFTKVQGLSVSADPAMCPKRIVNFGAFVCIWPDKKYFNTVNLEDVGSMDRLFSIGGAGVALSLCRNDGTDYDMTQITVSATAPSNPSNGKLWIDQSGDEDVLRQYTTSTGEWLEVATTFVKISATGIGTGLTVYDAFTLSGLEAVSGASARVKSQVAELNGSKILYSGGVNYVVVAGLLSSAQAALKSGTTVRADRKVPDLDWVCESNNRLWGCRYGMVDGQVVNELKASALGDFRNWDRYLGNSQDSYTANVGTDGPFTGAVTQKGYPVFFKENCIHQVYGTAPGSFQVNTTVCRGVQAGSGRSVVVVNEKVYYKSRTDVMMFDGSMPQPISAALGDIRYSDARAGALGSKYYISMKNLNDEWSLFTYDTENNVWYREDSFRALGFGRVADELFAVGEEDNRMWSMGGSVGTIEEDFAWSAEFGLYGSDYRGAKYLSRFGIRMYLEEGSRAKLEIQYDSDGVWHEQGEIRGSRLRSFVIPVVPRRCDHLRFRIRGEGQMRVYAISRMMEDGNDG